MGDAFHAGLIPGFADLVKPPRRPGQGNRGAGHRDRSRSYMTMAPAMATLTQKLVGIFTT